MMDLISTFMHKNLEDFVKSYASSIFAETNPNNNYNSSESDNKNDSNQQNKESNTIEHKEYSQPESPHLLSVILSPDSFIDKSIVESITSETNKTLLNEINESELSEDENKDKQINQIDDNITDDRNNKMYGEYGKEKFDLSVDILPMVTTNNEIKHTLEKIKIESIVENDKFNDENDANNTVCSETNDQWTELPNVVNTDIKLDLSNGNNIKSLSVSANDSFLTNIAKEIELLDEELSSMGLITGNNSQIFTKTNSINNDKMGLIHNNEQDNEQEIVVIKEKLSLLRKSLIFKKKNNENEELKCDNNINISVLYDSFIEFADDKEKDAFFDPLASPIKKINNIEYTEAIYHENATKIQKQWKKFQLKTLLINTFNRHLKQAKNNKLPLTVADLMASTTHEIVDHAEKLFSLVHDNNNNNNNNNNIEINETIGNYNYNQLHFYGSPALDWSATYSMIESIVLRNLLYYQNSQIVKKIFDTQQILDDMFSTNHSKIHSNADNILIDQLTTQLIQLKTQLYESCSNNIDCHINPLQLFPPTVNIFRPNHCEHKHTESNSIVIKQSSPIKSIENTRNDTNSTSSKPEFNQIRNQLSLLRKSFSQRRRNVKKIRSSIRSSPKLSSSLCSSIMQVNDQIHSLCNTQTIRENQSIDDNDSNNDSNNDSRIITPQFAFDINDNDSSNIHQSQHRLMTASNQSLSSSIYQYRYELPPKKPYLKRKKQFSKTMIKKTDWSHVKPKTVSRLSNDVRCIRMANNRRSHYKPNSINWKQRVSSRVDCNWSPDKYRSSTKIKKPKQRKQIIPKKQSNEFVDTYHNNNNNNNYDDKYLYYLKKGNKIGKISRDSAEAQLHDGSGPMILQTKQNCQQEVEDDIDNVEIISSHDVNIDFDDESYEGELQSDNQLKELQQTFAAIEKAMKQRRQQQHL